MEMIRGHEIQYHYDVGYETIVTVDIDGQTLRDEAGEIRAFRDTFWARKAVKEQLGVHES